MHEQNFTLYVACLPSNNRNKHCALSFDMRKSQLSNSVSFITKFIQWISFWCYLMWRDRSQLSPQFKQSGSACKKIKIKNQYFVNQNQINLWNVCRYSAILNDDRIFLFLGWTVPLTRHNNQAGRHVMLYTCKQNCWNMERYEMSLMTSSTLLQMKWQQDVPKKVQEKNSNK